MLSIIQQPTELTNTDIGLVWDWLRLVKHQFFFISSVDVGFSAAADVPETRAEIGSG